MGSFRDRHRWSAAYGSRRPAEEDARSRVRLKSKLYSWQATKKQTISAGTPVVCSLPTTQYIRLAHRRQAPFSLIDMEFVMPPSHNSLKGYAYPQADCWSR